MNKHVKQGILAVVFLGLTLLQSLSALAQSYEETLNFIFNGNKQWSSVSFQTMMSNQLTNFNQEKCTVDLVSTPYRRRGTINLKAITRWNWKPTSDGTLSFGLLRLESEGDIFDGDYYTQGSMKNGCGKNCSFITPIDFDTSRLTSAFQHLWGNYCEAGKPASAF
jgi:hypothetical protein